MHVIYSVRRLVDSNLGWFLRTRDTLGESAGRERAININADVMRAWFPGLGDSDEAPIEITNVYLDGAAGARPITIISDTRTIRRQGGGKNWRLAGDAIRGDLYDIRKDDLMLMCFQLKTRRLSWVVLRRDLSDRPVEAAEDALYQEAVSRLGADKGNMWLPDPPVMAYIVGKLQKQYPTIGRLMMTDMLMLESWRNDLRDSGFECDESLPRRLLTGLKAKRFAILSGLTGSGKTLLARSFAKWVTQSVGAYCVIPVGANWMSNESIIGYPDALDDTKYHKTLALEVIVNALANPDEPHLIILDEMNLSHVERYFSDFLSAIESPEEPIFLHGDDHYRSDIPPSLSGLPDNLYIIGTVNVDETTYMFSPKVLDRAIVIEFRSSRKAVDRYLSNRTKPVAGHLQGRGACFGSCMLNASRDESALVISVDEVEKVFALEMRKLLSLLSNHRAEIGFRSLGEMARYFEFSLRSLVPPGDEDVTEACRLALDEVVVQKVLPRLHGSRRKLEPLLDGLLEFSRDARGWGQVKEAGNAVGVSAVAEATAGYSFSFLPLTVEKLERMKQMLEDGFASFAEA